MTEQGPSKDAIAKQVVRQQIVQRMKQEAPDLYLEYKKHDRTERKASTEERLVLLVAAAPVLGALNGAISWWVAILLVVVILFAAGMVLSSSGSIDDDDTNENEATAGQNERRKSDRELLSDTAMISQNVFMSKTDKIAAEFLKREHAKKNEVEKELMMAAQKINEDEYLGKGIRVVTGASSNVIIGSNVQNSFNSLSTSDPELANSIATIAGFVEESENKEAGTALEDLVDELKGNKKPSRVKAFWNALVGILPDVAKLGTAAATITKFF